MPLCEVAYSLRSTSRAVPSGVEGTAILAPSVAAIAKRHESGPLRSRLQDSYRRWAARGRRVRGSSPSGSSRTLKGCLNIAWDIVPGSSRSPCRIAATGREEGHHTIVAQFRPQYFLLHAVDPLTLNVTAPSSAANAKPAPVRCSSVTGPRLSARCAISEPTRSHAPDAAVARSPSVVRFSGPWCGNLCPCPVVLSAVIRRLSSVICRRPQGEEGPTPLNHLPGHRPGFTPT